MIDVVYHVTVRPSKRKFICEVPSIGVRAFLLNAMDSKLMQWKELQLWLHCYFDCFRVVSTML